MTVVLLSRRGRETYMGRGVKPTYFFKNPPFLENLGEVLFAPFETKEAKGESRQKCPKIPKKVQNAPKSRGASRPYEKNAKMANLAPFFLTWQRQMHTHTHIWRSNYPGYPRHSLDPATHAVHMCGSSILPFSPPPPPSLFFRFSLSLSLSVHLLSRAQFLFFFSGAFGTWKEPVLLPLPSPPLSLFLSGIDSGRCVRVCANCQVEATSSFLFPLFMSVTCSAGTT